VLAGEEFLMAVGSERHQHRRDSFDIGDKGFLSALESRVLLLHRLQGVF
jgi:hypothetical protein